MLFLLSPAKSLDYDTPAGDVPHSLPQFAAQSAQLIQNLKPQSLQQIANLMDLSDALAALNVARYAVQKRITHVEKLKQFDHEGYAFEPAASDPHRLVFRRKTAGSA